MMYSLFPTPVFHENHKHLCDRFNSSQNDFKIVSDTLLDKGFELIKRMGLKTDINELENKDEVSAMSERVNIKPQQGDLIIFPSYLPHMFTVQKNNNILRFIHFNLHDKL